MDIWLDNKYYIFKTGYGMQTKNKREIIRNNYGAVPTEKY